MLPDYQFADKNILITGGCGFIGSHLCEYLVKSKANVTCLDNLETGKIQNISNLIKYDNFNFIEGDIRNYDLCLSSTKNQNYVLHQAALGSVPRSIKDPLNTNSVNITGFLNIINSVNVNNVERIVFASSSSIYGDSKKLPKLENKIGKPLSPYSVTKLVNELYSDVFSNIYNMNFIGLRYFNVFGPKQDPEGQYAAVIPLFIKKFLNRESPLINGDGNYSRDFTYIDNVVLMNILALKTKNKKSLNQFYNVACGNQITLNDLVHEIKDSLIEMGLDIDSISPKYGPIRDGDIPHSKACIKKAYNLLNYKPNTRFKVGIKKTTDWFLNFYNEST